PASGQEQPPVGQVDISFEVGDYNPRLDDWVIDVVVVSGDLEVGAAFTVELRGGGGEVLWSATQPFSGDPTRIVVDRPVAVGALTDAGVSQPQTVVAGVQIERPEVTWSAAGSGGSGQLALSMVLAIIVVAVVFRTPLPSASTQRWTK
ncbi:MAG TPA: hypothetical protein VFV32_07535, partial [Acidimicrobiales bacterium]|nr:hypothetical protein [Acidimicrobiales bacterium]